MRVIVVEDHQDLREVFTERLLNEGFDTVGVSCSEELDEQLVSATTHLVILDVNLPGESGLSIAKRLRAAHPAINIIIVSALTDERDRIQGYESGADFYLSKPVSPAELSAAVKAVHRRVESQLNEEIKLVLGCTSMTLSYGSIIISLSRSDVTFLKALALAPELRLPYWRLFEVTDREADENSKSQLELQVFRLRKKLAEISIGDTLIKSIRGEGYQLTSPIRIED